jgi:hypothetical protein
VALKKSNLGCIVLAALFLSAAGSVIWRNWGRNVGDLLVQQKPAETVVIGRWQLQSTSLPSVTNRTGKTSIRAEIVFQQNGRFTATDFPVEDAFSSPKWRLKSGEGRWELYRNQYWVVDVGFADGFSTPLDIRAKNGRVVALTYSVGDPTSRSYGFGDARLNESVVAATLWWISGPLRFCRQADRRSGERGEGSKVQGVASSHPSEGPSHHSPFKSPRA